MKKTKILIALLFALLICAVAFTVTSSANSFDNNSFTLDSRCNVIVDITYDTYSMPSVTVVSPNGRSYSSSSLSDGVEFEHDSATKRMRFYIPDAAVGRWNINYDSSLQGHLQVNCMKYTRNIEIENFTLNYINGNTASVSFKTNFPKSVSYSYTVSAVTLDSTGNVDGKKVLYNGNATSGKSVTCNVGLSSLQSYGSYYLLLEVLYVDYEIDATDSMLSDEFSYTNGSQHSPITDYVITYNASEGDLSIDWSGFYLYGVTAYTVAVESGGETLYSETFDSSVKSVNSIITDPAAGDIKVGITYVKNGISSQIEEVFIYPSNAGVKIEANEITSFSHAEITYSSISPCDAYVTVNNSVNEKVMLSGSGSFSVPLEDGYNDISIKQIYSENIVFVVEKRILLDRYAPIIEFFENLSNVTTAEKTFVVVGSVESGCEFKVNDQVQSVASDGTFSCSLTLNYGENQFEFTATDAAGNVSKRTVKITSAAPAETSILSSRISVFGIGVIVLIALAALSFLVVIILIIKRKMFSFNNVLMLMFIVSLVITLGISAVTVAKIQKAAALDAVVNGEPFYQIAKESIDDANAYLSAYDEALNISVRYTKYTYIAAGTSVVLLLCAIAYEKLGKKENESSDG